LNITEEKELVDELQFKSITPVGFAPKPKFDIKTVTPINLGPNAKPPI